MSICSVPYEVIPNFFLYLAPIDQCALATTCKTMLQGMGVLGI
jgi:hypothetical protein